jgi:GNAT superfamily N-acetyltransferase
VVLTVRLATREDVTVIATLRRAWTEENHGGPVEDDGFDAVFAEWFEREHDQRVTWLAEVDGRAVGMLNLLVFRRMPRPRSAEAPGSPDAWGYVANVYVEPAARDAGTGRALLDAATSFADEHGLARLVLSPSRRSVPFYERAGFATATSLMLRPGR